VREHLFLQRSEHRFLLPSANDVAPRGAQIKEKIRHGGFFHLIRFRPQVSLGVKFFEGR
jgi:hypothetical protein